MQLNSETESNAVSLEQSLIPLKYEIVAIKQEPGTVDDPEFEMFQEPRLPPLRRKKRARIISDTEELAPPDKKCRCTLTSMQRNMEKLFDRMPEKSPKSIQIKKSLDLLRELQAWHSQELKRQCFIAMSASRLRAINESNPTKSPLLKANYTNRPWLYYK